MKKPLSDSDLNLFLKKLNVCYSPFHNWEQRKARKKHTDLFGSEIMEGEIYHRLRIDQFFSNDLKLKRQNMERYLYAIFINGPTWETESDNEIQRQLDKVREIQDKLRRVQK